MTNFRHQRQSYNVFFSCSKKNYVFAKKFRSDNIRECYVKKKKVGKKKKCSAKISSCSDSFNESSDEEKEEKIAKPYRSRSFNHDETNSE